MKPIIFSTEMVKAILEGRKPQARMVIKKINDEQWVAPVQLECEPALWTWRSTKTGEVAVVRCPYQVGETRWVRETHKIPDLHTPDLMAVIYRGDNIDIPQIPWRPSIHMPKWAARIFLEITGVRAERLQNISEEDAVAEGTGALYEAYQKATGNLPVFDREVFAWFWDLLNAKRGYGWESNPFVWIVDFRRENDRTRG